MDKLASLVPSATPRKPRVVESRPLPSQAEQDGNACQICKGRGFTRKDVPFGHPLFGKAIMCQCKVVENARRTLARTYSWLGADADIVEEFQSMTFASFDPRANGERVANAYRKARGYATLLKSPSEWRNGLFVGPLGVGKTHLACAVLNEARMAGIGCLFASGNELFQALYDSHFDESILKDAASIQVLCLDDMDKMQQKKMREDDDNGSYQRSTLFTLLNQRYVAKKPTIITANIDDDWRKWMHPAILSRLFGKGKVEAIGMQGQDYRMIGGA